MRRLRVFGPVLAFGMREVEWHAAMRTAAAQLAMVIDASNCASWSGRHPIRSFDLFGGSRCCTCFVSSGLPCGSLHKICYHSRWHDQVTPFGGGASEVAPLTARSRANGTCELIWHEFLHCSRRGKQVQIECGLHVPFPPPPPSSDALLSPLKPLSMRLLVLSTVALAAALLSEATSAHKGPKLASLVRTIGRQHTPGSNHRPSALLSSDDTPPKNGTQDAGCGDNCQSTLTFASDAAQNYTVGSNIPGIPFQVKTSWAGNMIIGDTNPDSTLFFWLWGAEDEADNENL